MEDLKILPLHSLLARVCLEALAGCASLGGCWLPPGDTCPRGCSPDSFFGRLLEVAVAEFLSACRLALQLSGAAAAYAGACDGERL